MISEMSFGSFVNVAQASDTLVNKAQMRLDMCLSHRFALPMRGEALESVARILGWDFSLVADYSWALENEGHMSVTGQELDSRIVAGTMFRTANEERSVLDGYCRNYWGGRPEAVAIAQRLIDAGKVLQPRLTGGPAPDLSDRRIWITDVS